MYCDYEALTNYSTILNQVMGEITTAIEEIEASATQIFDLWESPTRDYYYNNFELIKRDFDAIYNKILNIKQYVDSVIANYKAIDNR